MITPFLHLSNFCKPVVIELCINVTLRSRVKSITKEDYIVVKQDYLHIFPQIESITLITAPFNSLKTPREILKFDARSESC